MSILKLISHFQSPTDTNGSPSAERVKRFTFDPLTKFACAFSALIHNIHHPGIPNTNLVNEDNDAVRYFKGQNIAERQAFGIAWDLLLEDRFLALRLAIYSNNEDETRFRQLVMTSVISTDIFDLDQQQRWESAFGRAPLSDMKHDVDEKVIALVEQLIQASDIAHTMQHWSVYCKWNERMFKEMYQAFLEGQSDKDPTDSWYDVEILFFDNYIIPLAKRLKACALYFGVSGDEYLDFAIKNRNEWKAKGKEAVKQMKERLQ